MYNLYIIYIILNFNENKEHSKTVLFELFLSRNLNNTIVHVLLLSSIS